MKCLIPLAGPDLWTERFGLRPLVPVDGEPILRRALSRRAWAGSLASEDYIFVVRDVPGVADLCAFLRETWRGCAIATVSHLTQGALFSCLAGLAFTRPDEAIIIDLADILFDEGPSDPASLLATGYSAVVPVFTSGEPCYSYLRTENGEVVEAREKVVISDHASAGVYMFRDVQTFLRAAAHSADHASMLSVRGALFICPMVNGVIAGGGRVAIPHIATVSPVGKIFHGV